MELLYSNIPPVRTEAEQRSIKDALIDQFAASEEVLIAVGYVTAASLEELDRLAQENDIRKITLLIGMYFIEGMPEGSYHTAVRINKRWTETGLGEIRIIKSFKYHGKIYLFQDGAHKLSAVIGSSNLSVLKPDASTLRQYETAVMTDESEQCNSILSLLNKLLANNVSENIGLIRNMPLIQDVNTALDNYERVTRIPPSAVQIYKKHGTRIRFALPLKVPYEWQKLIDGQGYFTQSNINVCYAAPRSIRKSRDWYEMQLTVSVDITRCEGYPEKNAPFFIVTDDGYWFKAHTTSDHNKQFAAVGDELIMGRWMKGRLAAAGLVKPINDTGKDTERKGMITKEMLTEYGRDCLFFTKTDLKALDEEDNELDIWFMSFEQTEN